MFLFSNTKTVLWMANNGYFRRYMSQLLVLLTVSDNVTQVVLSARQYFFILVLNQ